jgi:hypothetical protein
VQQAASWESALLAAEAGVEMAMSATRKELYKPVKAGQSLTGRNRRIPPLLRSTEFR